MGALSSRTWPLRPLTPAEERSRLVGESVEVRGNIYYGPHGISEKCEPGKPGTFYNGTGCINGIQLPAFCYIFCCWPISTIIWVIIFAFNFACTPCCFPCLGVRWCYRPTQISYIHAIYVVWNTLKHTWWGTLFCCGWFVQSQPGVLFTTVLLATPPRFLFDEDSDDAYLMTFEEYVEKQKSTFPPYSGRYRAIDGGGNHERYTFLGQSKRGYAMNEPYCVLSPSVMPDAEAMQRDLQLRPIFKPGPFGHNSLSTWFANVAIHDFFRTATGKDNRWVGGVDKPWVNLHDGYLDLQVLYGFNKEIADSVRSFKDGHLTRVAENRFDGQRLPETWVIVELLRREHNYVCDELSKRYPEQFRTDEQLYQQARLIMGGVFINVILRQYGDQMFGENAPDGGPFAELRLDYGYWPPVGSSQYVGNHSTFNFNLIYRWHTGIPQEWDPADVPPTKTDEDLRKILTDSLNWEAGGFGPNNMPDGLFPKQAKYSVPATSVLQGRANGAPRLNDFRRRFGLPYRDFLDMCGNAEVAARVAQWYPTVEDVELPVGIQVERCMAGGWGLSSTTGIAIIADAFNSIRQDRFYTTDFTPEIYTEWGYEFTKTTILADIINRQLHMGIPRDIMLARLPTWAGPPSWSQMQSWPCSVVSFTERGFAMVNGEVYENGVRRSAIV